MIGGGTSELKELLLDELEEELLEEGTLEVDVLGNSLLELLDSLEVLSLEDEVIALLLGVVAQPVATRANNIALKNNCFFIDVGTPITLHLLDKRQCKSYLKIFDIKL